LPKDLIRLTYVSTLRPNVTGPDVDELVAKAARFNTDHDITGVLAIDKMRVCQILEGPADAVDRLFEAIERDNRHQGVTQIERRAIDASSFEAWGMARRDMIDMVLFALA
jgi:hypothetical protein